MNRIVREGYPVAQLPEDLQHALFGQRRVTLTIDWDIDDSPSDQVTAERPEPIKSLEELFAMSEPVYASLDEVTAHVRALRDEWSGLA